MNTMREFALTVDSNKKIPCCTGELDQDLIDLMLCAGSDAEQAEQPAHCTHMHTVLPVRTRWVSSADQKEKI